MPLTETDYDNMLTTLAANYPNIHAAVMSTTSDNGSLWGLNETHLIYEDAELTNGQIHYGSLQLVENLLGGKGRGVNRMTLKQAIQAIKNDDEHIEMINNIDNPKMILLNG